MRQIDAAIIELLLQTGMRLSELVNLKVDDIELPKKITKEPFNVGSIHIIGKGGKGKNNNFKLEGMQNY